MGLFTVIQNARLNQNDRIRPFCDLLGKNILGRIKKDKLHDEIVKNE